MITEGNAGVWPHWRGPDRSGVIAESSGFKEGVKWMTEAPEWVFEAGEGSTSPLVIDGAVYVMGWSEGKDTLACLDLATGKPRWTQSYETPRHARFAAGDQRRYGGPTSSPEYDPDSGLLFTLGADGELRAWRIANDKGALAWRKNLYEEYGVAQRPKTGAGLRDYGYTTAPLVVGGVLLVEVGSEKGTVMAFDPASGEEKWRSQYTKQAGHTGGLVPLEVEGIPCVAVLALYDLVVLRLDAGSEGETVATHSWVSDYANNILTPAVEGSDILISSYHTHRSIRRVKIQTGKAEKTWEQLFASHVGSPVIHGDRIYFAGRRLYCLEWETGELAWEGGMFGDGASLVVTGDERVLAFGGDCSLSLVNSARRSPESYEEVAKITGATAGGPGDAWSHVVLADGWVLCKNRQGQVAARRIEP